MSVKLLIADSDAFTREATRQTFASLAPSYEVATVTDGYALMGYLTLNPDTDLVLLDLDVTGISGIQLLANIRDQFTTIKVIVTAQLLETSAMRDVERSGALAYLLKSEAPQTLISVVRQVLGETRDYPTHDQFGFSWRLNVEPQASGMHLTRLTRRQLEILTMMVDGLTNEEISQQLNISHNTVKVHVSAVLRALGVNSRVKAAAAIRKTAVASS